MQTHPHIGLFKSKYSMQLGHFWLCIYWLILFSNKTCFQAKPPQYDVSKIAIPIAIVSGGHDTLSDPEDVALLMAKLKNLVYYKKLEEYNHVDFVTALNANVLLYPDLVELGKEYSNSNDGK